MLAQASTVALVSALAILDLRSYKIRNVGVVAVIALYFPAQGLLGFPDLWTDIAAGALLFAIGFVVWLVRGLGAGDVKLMFALGLHLGWTDLLPFAVLVSAGSLLLYMAIMVAHLVEARSGLGGWLAACKRERKVPYGVVLAFASIPPLMARIVGIS